MTWLTIIVAAWLSTVGFFGPTGVMEVPVRTTAAQVGTLGLEVESSPQGEGARTGTLGLAVEDSPRQRRIGTLRLEIEDSPSPRVRRVRGSYRLPTGTLDLDLE